jgi:outer membrane immunogenic protein
MISLVASSVILASTAAAQSDRFAGPTIGLNLGYGFSAKPDELGVRQVSNNSFLENYGPLGPKGFLGGIGLGYGLRAGGLIVGADGDIAFGRITDTHTETKAGLTVTGKGTLSTLGTLRARVGVPVSPSAQVYLTGGLAGASYDYSLSYAGVLNGNLTRNSTTFGWAAGAGAEWAIDSQWSLKAEYLYLDLMKRRSITDGTISTIGHLQQSQIRAGLNYKF